MSERLSRKQQTALDFIDRIGQSGGTGLARVLDTSEQGAHATAASLVRRGLVVKDKGGPFVVYRTKGVNPNPRRLR